MTRRLVTTTEEYPDNVLALTKPELIDTPCGFRKVHQKVNQIWVTCQIVVKSLRVSYPLLHVISPRHMIQWIVHPW